MKKISLIIPVYNCENYLEDMVTSILSQVWEDIEIILSDDGSTDGSLEKARRLAEKHREIIVLTGENTGVSGARNRGLAVATGDYIGFCDADDTLSHGYLEGLANLLEQHQADVACCGFSRVYESSGKEDHLPTRMSEVTETDGDGFQAWLLRPDGFTTVMWNKLFRRQVLLREDGSFRQFDETIHIVEDGEFIFRLHVEKAVFTPTPLYRYVVRRSGAMYGRLNPRKLTELDARRKIVEYSAGSGTEVQGLAKMKYQKGVRDLMFHALIDGQGKDVRHLRPELKRWRRELYSSDYLSKKEKLKYRVYRLIIALNMRHLGAFFMEKLSGH